MSPLKLLAKLGKQQGTPASRRCRRAFAFAALLFAHTAHSDGFVCDSTHESLRIQVYNHTQPRSGTRNVAVMVLSDPSKPWGERTLARFTAEADGLTNRGATYVAVLSRSSNLLSATESRRLQGLQLGQLEEIVLNIDFSYTYPVGHGDFVAGVLELNQISGDQLWVDLDCRRYLKSRN
jgi:hypothetical protein